jgi:hypothetical protein
MKYDSKNTMNNDTSIRKDVIHFLEDITNRLKNRSSSPDEERHALEFYMKMLSFSDENNENNENNTNNTNNTNNENNMKYFTLGWYIYENLLKNT